MQHKWLLEYTYLGDGETAAGQLCPQCKGGRTNEYTMSVSRNGSTLLWKCHRASCPFAGTDSAGRFNELPSTAPTPTRGMVGRVYLRQADKVPEHIRECLERDYFFSQRQVNLLGWIEEEQRVVLPVTGWNREELGCVLRSESGAKPKALTHTEPDAIACFRNWQSKECIIVEDIYSAIRASEYVSAVALLGTNINEERISTITEPKFNKYFLALDRDAFGSAIRMSVRYKHLCRMNPVKLDKDIKNMAPYELKEFMHEIKN